MMFDEWQREQLQLIMDQYLYGFCCVDEDGRRVDPTSIEAQEDRLEGGDETGETLST